MKKMFSQMVKAINSPTKQLMLVLSVLVFSANLYAGNHSYTMNAKVATTGTGKVYVSKTEVAIGTITARNWGDSKYDSYSAGKDNAISNINFWVYANAEPGYYFVNWTGDVTGSVNPGAHTGKSLAANANDVSKTATANFASIFEFPYGKTITLYTDPVTGEVLPATIQIKVNKSTSLTITPNNAAFSVVTNSPVSLNGTVGEYVTIQITATEGTAQGDYANAIKLSPNHSTLNDTYMYEPNDEYLNITILPSPTIIFNPPLNPVGGSYTYQQTNIVPKPNPVLVNEVKEIGLLDGNDGVIELVATPATGYRVYRWISTHGGVEEIDYLSGKKKLVNWTKDAEVTVEFTEDKYASFFVKENPSIKYNDLNLAIEAAASSSSKTVVVDPTYNNTARCNGGYLRAGTYTIPDGYTLLVPGDDAYTTLGHQQNPSDAQWAADGESLAMKNYSKLIMESGSTINVDGVLCVYAKWNYCNSNATHMKPGNYAWIEMEDNSVININDATLHALGYITNSSSTNITESNIDNVGRVVANANAVVYEIFSISDWRGGSALFGTYGENTLGQIGAMANAAAGNEQGMVKNSKHVFPINQYFIQNIEAPLILNFGSKEKVCLCVDAGMMAHAVIDFIVTNDNADPENSNIASGLFRMGNNTKVIKYYDVSSDRLKLQVDRCEESVVETIPTFFHTLVMTLDAGVASVNVSSNDYVLPFNNNMDLTIKSGSSVTLHEGRDVAFLPGATMTIEKNAVANINANVYIYDADQKKFNIEGDDAVNAVEGFFGSSNKALYLVPTRPGGTQPAKRIAAGIEDAKLHVDGIVNVNGALYTTASGANITSSGGGEILFNSEFAASETYQAYQNGNAYFYPIPITNAKLHNANGTYSAGNYVTSGQRYLYYTDINGGTWSLPRAAVSSVTLPTLSVTLPTQFSPTGEIVCDVTKPEGVRDYLKSDFLIENSNPTLFALGDYRIEGEQLIIPITYNKQDKHSDENITATLTIKKSNTAAVSLVEKEIIVVATEKYKPDFSAITSTLSSTVGTPISTGVNFSLVQENVTTIWDDATYGSRFEWSTSTPAITGNNASEFTFAYGIDENKLAGAMVTFTPASAYPADALASATLTLVATYTDGAGYKESTSIDIPLSGTATLNSNTLTFALPFPAPIYEDSEAFPLFEEDSRNNTEPIQFTLTPTGIVKITGDGTDANPYMVQPLTDGVVEVSVSQSASASVKGIEEGTMKITIQVQPKQVELYPLDLCVDSQDKFSAHTLAAQLVRFDNNAIVFTSNESQTAIWEMQFEGVPQHVTFELSGTNNWLVQQGDKEGENWENLPISATGTFDGSLLPTTRRLKFTYAMGNSEGSLTNLCIDELNLSATTNKVYLPINADGSLSSVEFEFVHTKNLTFSTIDALGVSTNTINAGTTEEPYLTTTVIISPNASTELNKNYTLTANDGETTKSVIIRTYRFPQFLPINLETDPVERFYFVNLAGESNTKYVGWNEDSREIIYQNPGGQEARYATFAFEGAPHHISFDIDGDVNVSDWVVLERSEGEDFVAVATAPIVNGQTITYELDYSSKYVRVDNISTNMSEVRLSNFIIEGKPEMFADPEELLFNKNVTELPLMLTAVNLDEVRFELTDPVNFAFKQQGNSTELTTLALDKDTYNDLGYNKYCDIPLNVIWKAQNMVDAGKLIVYDDKADTVMLEVRLLGADQYLVKENAGESGIYTGIPDGYTFHGSLYTEYQHHEINLINAFEKDGNKALFDYLFIYGETTPSSGTDITAPGTNGVLVGSNAVTPYYVYKRSDDGLGYLFAGMVDNANTTDKSQILGITSQDENTTVYIDVQDSLSVYMTGFCPYATTGCTTDQEGVWFFRGEHGETLNVYLEDCHIFSRNKTVNGNAFYGEKEGGETYDDDYTKGSGGVLVFENTHSSESLASVTPFQVRIHTLNDNLLKSNHGCFFLFMNSMKAYQVSAPIHVHMHSEDHIRTSKTTLDFDDHWPTSLNEEGNIASTERTNGYLALMKQTNNAPSIDLGNPNTVVNFRGGRIKLQNAQIVSTNYKTTLAISYRSGEFGAVGEGGKGLKLSYGIGTDSIGGTVNFYDGTIMVEPMLVKEEYKQYYLIDKDEAGNEIKEYKGNDQYGQPIYAYQTSCLRCPKNTYVRGGSICPIRACQHVTSKGGAPKDSPTGASLGLYVYTLSGDDEVAENGLATKIQFPLNVTNPNLKDYYDSKSYTYGVRSVDPDAANKLYFWIPDGYGNVEAEKDKFLSVWKACMTSITAGLGEKGGSIGGDTPIESNEEVKYFLYCQLDESTYQVISETEEDENGNERLKYEAPMEVPTVAQNYFGGDKYTRIRPVAVGDELQHQVMSDSAYTITDKVYYVTTATADVWQTFTAPFDVAKIWVVESYDENILKKTPKDEENGLTKRQSVMLEQAKHNADFAAFFAVAMALGTYDDFEGIYSKYIKWAEEFEKRTPNTQGKAALIPYLGDNWKTAHFYLNHNKDNWELDAEADTFKVKWDMLTSADIEDGILLHQGETYSMLFPYCTGCWEYDGEGEDASVIEREFWDYWSGKFLIFESTDGNVKGPHIIQGSNYIAESKIEEQPWIFDKTISSDDEAAVTGNSTFAMMSSSRNNIYTYTADPGNEMFVLNDPDEYGEALILPTTSFLYANIPVNQLGMPAKKVTREGKIIYGNGNGGNGDGGVTTGGGNVPTVGGGNDLFITAISGGINVAVAAPQHVRVISSTGIVLFNGMVQSSVNVFLPLNGIYVVSGENEVQKILY